MSSQTRGVLGAVKTALQTINGAGSYTYDLSATDKVKLGTPNMDGSLYPCAWIGAPELRSEHGPQLGRYRRTLTIPIWGMAAATSSSTEERGLVASDLLDDIAVALETDRTLGSRVLDIIVQGATFDGDEVGIPGVGLAVAVVEVYWHCNSAAGV